MKPILAPIFLALFTALAAPVLGQAAFTQAQMEAAPECAKGRDLKENTTELCSCKARGFDRFIWGTGPYSGHSDICTAARFAGIITKEDGGVIVAIGLAGQNEYTEGEANGIKGRRWGRYSNSFDVALAATFGGAPTGPVLACQAYSAASAPYTCSCPAGAGNTGSVWGDGPYTGDSDVCSAARHAGAVGEAGGVVQITAEPAQRSYTASKANGVTTNSWGPFDESFAVTGIKARANGAACKTMPNGADTHQCVCGPAKGAGLSVWGSHPYTADSDICTAARHAGVLSEAGGAVNVLRVRGLAAYAGSQANGVTTSNWQGFDSSIVFNGN